MITHSKVIYLSLIFKLDSINVIEFKWTGLIFIVLWYALLYSLPANLSIYKICDSDVIYL